MPIIFTSKGQQTLWATQSNMIPTAITGLTGASTVAGQITLTWSGGLGNNVKYSYALSNGAATVTSSSDSYNSGTGVHTTTVNFTPNTSITTNVTVTATVLGGSASASYTGLTTASPLSLFIISLGGTNAWTSTNGTSYTNNVTSGANSSGGLFTWQAAFNKANNKYYFGSNGGSQISYTTNGINYSVTSNFTQTYIRAVCYANNMLVASCGESASTIRMIYCTDGVNWNYGTTLTTTLGGTIYSIAYSTVLNIWVAAISSGNYIWWSTDGINWTAGTISGFGGANGTIGVNDTGSGLFILANASGSTNFFYSTDGKTWTARPNSPFGTTGACSVYYSPTKNLWLAGSQGAGGIATSTDSITWTVTNTTTTYVISPQYIPSVSLWVCYAFSGNAIYYSSDTITWTKGSYSGSPYGCIVANLNDRTSFS